MLNWFKKKTAIHVPSSDPTLVMEAILGRGINWYDFDKLDQAGKQTYHADAQAIIGSEVFTNELKHYLADLVHFCATEARDFQAVMNIRASIVALETFSNRLASIKKPDRLETELEPFTPI